MLFAAIAAADGVGAEVVNHLHRAASPGEVFFPAAGVTVAALLLLPRRMWLVILDAAFSTELVADLAMRETITTAVGSAVANTVGPVGAALLLAWIGRPPLLSRRRQLLAFIAGPAVIGAGAGGLIGATATVFTHAQSQFAVVLIRWWTGDAPGVLIMGGLLVAWLTEAAWPIRPRYRTLEADTLAATARLFTWLAFWNWQPGLTYLCLLAALRGTRATSA